MSSGSTFTFRTRQLPRKIWWV